MGRGRPAEGGGYGRARGGAEVGGKGEDRVCVECLIGKQKKPILFKVTEPSSIPYSHGCQRGSEGEVRM